MASFLNLDHFGSHPAEIDSRRNTLVAMERPEFCSPMMRPISLPAMPSLPPLELAEPEPFILPSDRTLTRWKKMMNLDMKMKEFEEKEDFLYDDGNELISFSNFAEHAVLVTMIHELNVEDFYCVDKIPTYTACRNYVSDLDCSSPSSGRQSPNDEDLLCRKSQQQAIVKAKTALRSLPLMSCEACRMDQVWCCRQCKMRTFIGLDDIYKSVLATGADVRKVE